MGSLCFIDTNILVYVYDRRDQKKRKIATDLLNNIVSGKKAVISTQIAQEFCNAVLHKIKIQNLVELEHTLATIVVPLIQHYPSGSFYSRAIQLYDRYSISFYDALIVQAALDLGCDTLYSEDLQDGHVFGKLKVINPFKQRA